MTDASGAFLFPDLAPGIRNQEFFVRDFARVPAKVRLGEVEVGPAAFLLAMAQAVRKPDAERNTTNH